MTAEFSLAVHALVYLLRKGTVVSSRELAENICTNPARVRKVMAKLQRAGLVDSFRGKGSGYQTRPDSAGLPLDRVLSALKEEPVSVNWRSGSIDKKCLLASGMGEIMDGLCADMNAACRRQLEAVTIGDVDERIFSGKRA